MPIDPIPFTLVLEGLIFLVAAWISARFPARKINLTYGYRTKASMASQERWDFAQAYARREMTRGGLYLIAGGLVLATLPIPGQIVLDLIVVLGGTVWVCVWLYRKTEAAISARFDSGHAS
ncbi:MAG: SdpI family protein [Rhodothermales bacterium]